MLWSFPVWNIHFFAPIDSEQSRSDGIFRFLIWERADATVLHMIYDLISRAAGPSNRYGENSSSELWAWWRQWPEGQMLLFIAREMTLPHGEFCVREKHRTLYYHHVLVSLKLLKLSQSDYKWSSEYLHEISPSGEQGMPMVLFGSCDCHRAVWEPREKQNVLGEGWQYSHCPSIHPPIHALVDCGTSAVYLIRRWLYCEQICNASAARRQPGRAPHSCTWPWAYSQGQFAVFW